MRRTAFPAVLLAVIMASSVVTTAVAFVGGATTLGHTVAIGTDAAESEYPALSDALDVLDPGGVESAAAEPVAEPALVSPTTLGAVVGALVLALLVVALVRRADR